MTLTARPRLRLFLTVALMLLSAGPLTIAFASVSAIGHRWVDILAQFVGPALIGALALLFAGLLLRLRAAIVTTGLVCFAVVVAGSPQWFPPKGWPAGDEGFTLYFANLYARNDDVEAVRASIAAAQPDVVVLIEVGQAVGSDLDTVLSGLPYRLTTPHPGWGGQSVDSVLASRWPLNDLTPDLGRVHGVAGTVETPIGPIAIAGVHLTRPWPYQFQWGQIIQAQEIIDWRQSVDGPLVVAGDFNSVSSARIGRMIRAEAGLIAAPGWPGTWPSALPSAAGITIDQVYRSPNLALIDRRLGRPNGSDHRPVVTRLVRAQTPPDA